MNDNPFAKSKTTKPTSTSYKNNPFVQKSEIPNNPFTNKKSSTINVKEKNINKEEITKEITKKESVKNTSSGFATITHKKQVPLFIKKESKEEPSLQKDTIDIQHPVKTEYPSTENHEPEIDVESISIQQELSDRQKRKDKDSSLSPVEFYCQKYSIIREIADMVLSAKYGNKLIDALHDISTRIKIEQESIRDVRDYLISKNIAPSEDSLMQEYIRIVFAENLGFGILEYMLHDKEVDEIMVKNHQEIYIEKHGILELTPYKFPSYDVALGVVRKIIQPLNKTLDTAHPNVDGQLPDGSRISTSIPPLKADGDISMTIRKFPEKVEPLSYYAKKYNTLTPEMITFLDGAVKAKKNILVSGGTGSGKTTTLNALSYFLHPTERVITIEDVRELRLQIPHVEPYQVVNPNAEGKGGISIQEIIQMVLRKRPDRVFVGECRGPEIVEFQNAANTGHEGSITSIHSNSPRDAFDRMENMMRQNDSTKNMTSQGMKMVLASSVDIIVQINRLRDGSRRITQITEVLGYGQTGFNKLKKTKQIKENAICNENEIYLRDIFRFKEGTLEECEGKRIQHGCFEATGYIPTFKSKINNIGITLKDSFFEKRKILEV